MTFKDSRETQDELYSELAIVWKWLKGFAPYKRAYKEYRAFHSKKPLPSKKKADALEENIKKLWNFFPLEDPDSEFPLLPEQLTHFVSHLFGMDPDDLGFVPISVTENDILDIKDKAYSENSERRKIVHEYKTKLHLKSRVSDYDLPAKIPKSIIVQINPRLDAGYLMEEIKKYLNRLRGAYGYRSPKGKSPRPLRLNLKYKYHVLKTLGWPRTGMRNELIRSFEDGDGRIISKDSKRRIVDEFLKKMKQRG